MATTTINPIPLYPTYAELQDLDFSEYAELKRFLDSGPTWRQQHWQWGREFLRYIGRNKSEHTYGRFRGEVERFLNWSFLFKQKPVDDYRKADVLEYADFCWSPPKHWIAVHSVDRFQRDGQGLAFNPAWKPFRFKLPKGVKAEDAGKLAYRPSQQTLTATFTAIIAFYKYLMNEEYCFGNPAQIAKQDCRHFIADAQVKGIRRLTESQWQYTLDTARHMADQDPDNERQLFIVAALKSLFLRVSELSERRDWLPVMSHFWEDDDGNWWLKVYGKGRKLRDITVPLEFLPYLKRYRESRGLPALPFDGENSPIVEKVRGQGGMTSRHLTRLVQQVFNAAYEKMRSQEGESKARKLREASTHWLRHTGASMEIERGRALKDVSEDLGHASMATTDSIYVQTENRRRAQSGKGRKV